MKALVTGGAGFIGSHVVTRLVNLGWDVSVLDDLSSGHASRVPDAADLVEVDVSGPSTARTIALIRPELIVHAAAQVSVARSMIDAAGDRAVNVIGTENVIEGARRSGTPRLVFLSTGGAIYGDNPRASESDPPAPSSFYAIHKYTAEAYVAISGLPYAIARLANVYGRGQRSDLEGGVISIFGDALQQGRSITIFGNGRQERDFVHVDDVTSALITMAASDRSGSWNVGTGISISLLDLVAAMARLLGEPLALNFEPARAGDVFRSCLIAKKAEVELGWSPSLDLTAGLARTFGLDSLDAP